MSTRIWRTAAAFVVLASASAALAQVGSDDCASAPAVGAPSTSFGDTFSASNDGTGSCGASAGSPDVWYLLTNTSGVRSVYTIDTFGSTYDTVLGAFSACGGTELDCNDDTQDLQSQIEITLAVGASARIRVSGFAGDTGSYTLNIAAPQPAPPPVANDDCATAISIMAGSSTTGDNVGASSGGLSGCAFGDTLDVWFRMTAPVTGEYQFDTFGSDLLPGGLIDTTLAVYAACDGQQLDCNDDDPTGENGLLSLVIVNLNAGQQVFIRVAGFAGTRGAFVLNATGGTPPPPPPPNDDCATASSIGALPFDSGDIPVGGAGDDQDVSCNDTEAFATHNGVWFRYTPPADELIRIRETSSSRAVIAVFAGGCAASEALCTAAEAAVIPLSAGTQYVFLVGAAAANPLRLTAQLHVTISQVTAPGNDTCAQARFVPGFPFAESVDGTTASSDIDVSCNQDTNIEARFGVWYALTPNEAGTLEVNEISRAGAVITLFEGPCGALTEVACVAFGAIGPVRLTPGTTYHVMVSTWSDTDVPLDPYELEFIYTPAPGACCTAGNCTIVSGRDACTALGGAWQGVGVTCGGPSGYTIATSTATFEDISLTGASLATAGDCDDCGETVDIGFTFNYLGGTYTSVWVCSNGFIQFGDDNDTVFTNQDVPSPSQPNNMVCPLWDDLQPGVQGEVFVLADGAAPNRRLTVSWNNVTEFGVDPPDSLTFQVILHETSNNIEFRYGAIVPDAGGDYTVGFENSDGSAGGSFAAADLGSGSTALMLTAGGVQPSPCSAGATGACCNHSQCIVGLQASCAGAGTRFAGPNTACNAIGNFTTPCCRADANQNGSVSLQDVFDFLTLWFANSPGADIDQFPGVTIGDVFSFLQAWFGGGC